MDAAKTRMEASFPGASKVFVAGDFNDWDPEARRLKRVRKGEDTFFAVLDLEPGRYEFKYVVDGEWVCCPTSPKVANDQGTSNSVLEICE
jgi:1,4-alpha-glucan branching enzyme